MVLFNCTYYFPFGFLSRNPFFHSLLAACSGVLLPLAKRTRKEAQTTTNAALPWLLFVVRSATLSRNMIRFKEES